MTITEEIIAKRRSGVVHCGLSSRTSLAEAAREFALSDEVGVYHEIDADEARRLLRNILHRDLAYGVEIMPEAEAGGLADRFLAPFEGQGARYFTNGSFDKMSGPNHNEAGSWMPATSATFDTGVLVIGTRSSGCLWVEDED